MSRLLPAPLLSATLVVLWMVLNPVLSVANGAMALLVGLAVPWLTEPLLRGHLRVRHPLVALKLIGHVIVDVSVSNLTVLGAALASDKKQPTGTYIHMPLTLRDPAGLAMLAIILCMTPGTVWTRLKGDRSELLIHVLNLEDEAELLERLAQRYEAPLIRIFQS